MSNETVSLADLLATLAALTGDHLPANAGGDSYNMLPALLAQPHAEPIRPDLVVVSRPGEYSIPKGD